MYTKTVKHTSSVSNYAYTITYSVSVLLSAGVECSSLVSNYVIK